MRAEEIDYTGDYSDPNEYRDQKKIDNEQQRKELQERIAKMKAEEIDYTGDDSDPRDTPKT